MEKGAKIREIEKNEVYTRFPVNSRSSFVVEVVTKRNDNKYEA